MVHAALSGIAACAATDGPPTGIAAPASPPAGIDRLVRQRVGFFKGRILTGGSIHIVASSVHTDPPDVHSGTSAGRVPGQGGNSDVHTGRSDVYTGCVPRHGGGCAAITGGIPPPWEGLRAKTEGGTGKERGQIL